VACNFASLGSKEVAETSAWEGEEKEEEEEEEGGGGGGEKKAKKDKKVKERKQPKQKEATRKAKRSAPAPIEPPANGLATAVSLVPPGLPVGNPPKRQRLSKSKLPSPAPTHPTVSLTQRRRARIDEDFVYY
jgi:hypothetical protein